MSVTERWSPQMIGYVTGRYTAKREFDVTGAADGNTAIAMVYAFDSTTPISQPCPYNSWLYSTGPVATRPSLNVWLVTVGYASDPAGYFDDPGNPLSMPVHYRWEPLQYT